MLFLHICVSFATPRNTEDVLLEVVVGGYTKKKNNLGSNPFFETLFPHGQFCVHSHMACCHSALVDWPQYRLCPDRHTHRRFALFLGVCFSPRCVNLFFGRVGDMNTICT